VQTSKLFSKKVTLCTVRTLSSTLRVIASRRRGNLITTVETATIGARKSHLGIASSLSLLAMTGQKVLSQLR
jgi:hypothetical protein